MNRYNGGTEYSGAITNTMPPARARLYSESRAVAFGSTDRMDTPCVETTWRRDAKGYGRRVLAHRRWKAHRYAWEQVHGPIPTGVCVLHKCDNPPCILTLPLLPDGAHDPREHLFLGTIADNNADKIAKGRARNVVGERSGNARLTVAAVRDIRRRRVLGATWAALAREYGVTPAAARVAGTGRGWCHVDEPVAPLRGGRSPAARKTRCIRGHLFDRVQVTENRVKQVCSTCVQIHQDRYNASGKRRRLRQARRAAR